MAIPYNPARVNLKHRLFKTAEKREEELSNPDGNAINQRAYKRDLKKLSPYIKTSRDYLTRLKSKCNHLLDNTLQDLKIFKDLPNNPLANSAFLEAAPSSFLQKAYTEQTFYSDENENINRDQPYINAGKDFAYYCERNQPSLTNEEKLLNDYGTIIAAINSAISQMNRTEHEINSLPNSPDNDNYLKIFINAKSIANFIQLLNEEIIDKKPTILNSKAGFLANAYDDMLVMLENFTVLYNRYFKHNYTKVSTEEENMENISVKNNKP